MIRAGIVNLNLPPLRSEPTNSHQSEPKPIEDTVQPIVVTSEITNTDDDLLLGSETEFLSDPLADDQEENFESDETLTQCHSSVKLEQVEETDIDTSDETLTQCHSSVMLKEDPEVNESLAPLELEQVPNQIEQYVPKKALSGREMFAILTSPDIQTSVVRSIPCGFKQDVHFVTHNFNKGRYEINQPFNHPSDDIGAVKSSTKKYLYRFVPEDMDVQFVNKLHKYKGPPLSPDVKVIMKVVNSFKQTNKNYKRNIAYIVEAPALVKQAMDYCLVEYLGYDAEGGCSKEVHKNRKHGNVPYHKNDPQIMEGCKNDVRKNLSNKEVFNKWFDPSDPVMSIRSSRQISDMKRKTKKTHSKRSL